MYRNGSTATPILLALTALSAFSAVNWETSRYSSVPKATHESPSRGDALDAPVLAAGPSVATGLATLSASSRLQYQEGKVQSTRDSAYSQIHAGDLLGAAETLIRSFRDIPNDLPELADSVAGSSQLLLFEMEYLMDKETRETCVKQVFKPREYITDRFFLWLLFVYEGQDTENKTAGSRELQYLISEKNNLVRILGLYFLSDPYYYRGTAFPYQHSTLLAQEYPDLAISKEALRLSIYAAAKQDGKALSQALIDSATARTALARHAYFRELTVARGDALSPLTDEEVQAIPEFAPLPDDVLDALEPALKARAEGDDLGNHMSLLCDIARQSTDWRVRYAAILMAEPHKNEGFHAQFLDTVRQVAGASVVTPDVIRARVWLVRLGLKDEDGNPTDATTAREAAKEAEKLLNTSWVGITYERHLDEEILKTAMQCANALAARDMAGEAEALYIAIGAKYPNSKVATEIQERLRLLQPPLQ